MSCLQMFSLSSFEAHESKFSDRSSFPLIPVMGGLMVVQSTLEQKVACSMPLDPEVAKKKNPCLHRNVYQQCLPHLSGKVMVGGRRLP